ncbi:transposase [Cupriavidus taiwanensis]|uniref:Transposase n=3 Tax=Cupriavidus TaxID=106589 RepID=A0A375GN99_9BURK
MVKARELGHPADWLLRSQHNHNTLPGGGKLWDQVTQQF